MNTKNNGITSYSVYYSTGNDLTATTVSKTTAVNSNDGKIKTAIENLLADSTYYYKIVATNGPNGANKYESSTQSFKTTKNASAPAIAEFDFSNSYYSKKDSLSFSSNATNSFVTDRSLNANSALSITNTSIQATIPNLPLDSANRSISFWANIRTNAQNWAFLYGNNTEDKAFSVAIHPSVSYLYSFWNNSVTVSSTSTLNTWYHFVYVYDGINIKIYQNGVLKGTPLAKSLNTGNNNNLFKLGTSINGVAQFDGSIDDLKIFDRILSVSEITDLYNSIDSKPDISQIQTTYLESGIKVDYRINANGNPTTSVINFGLAENDLSNQIVGGNASGNIYTSFTSNLNGLVAGAKYYYQIIATNSKGSTNSEIKEFINEEPQSIAEFNFNNSRSSINGGYSFQTASTTFVPDRNENANSAIAMNNTSSTVTIPNLPSGTAKRSISVWIKLNAFNGDGYNQFFSYGTGSAGKSFGGSINATTARIIGYSTNAEFSTVNALNTWYHYVFIYDGTNSIIYKNGELLGSQIKALNTVTDNSFYIGRGVGGELAFNGAIDDLKIFDKELTSQQIHSLYQNNSLTSIKALTINAADIKLFPNPVQNVLNVETALDIRTVDIYNMQGQKVLTSNQKQVNVAALAAGVYVVKVQDMENKVATLKISVK